MKEGYKKTELGLIPSEWRINNLNKIVDICYGKSQKEVEESDGKYKILGTGGVIGYASNFLWDKPSVLIGRKGTIDKPQYIEEPFWTVDTLFYTKIKETNLAKWLFYYLNNIDLKKYNEATGVPSLSVGNLNLIKIITPPLKEQQKIAEILSSVDTQIDDTDKLIEKTKELKKGLMQRFLTKGIGHTEFKITEVGEIPVEWEVRCIGEISDLINGRAFKPSDWKKEGIPIIRIQNLNGTDEYNYYEGEVEDRYFIRKGQLLFSWSGSRGTSFGPHIWHGIDGVLNQHIFKVNIKEDIPIDINFIYYNLKGVTEKIEQEAHGSAGLVHITKGNLEKVKLSIPMLEEQIRIGNILSSVDTQIEEYENKKSKLEELKKGLMQQLLTGKIRVV